MQNVDWVPEVTGRQLGYPNKRWDANLRNVNISGTLTGTGIGIGAVVNATPDVDSLNISSDSGDGVVRLRMRLGNPAGGTDVPFELTNVIPKFGSSDAGLGGAIDTTFLSAVGDDPMDYISFMQRGQDETGLTAMRITTNGEVIHHGQGYATWIERSFNAAEAQPLFGIKPTGEFVWGPGGATVPDVGAKRLNPNLLGITNGAGADGEMQMRILHLTAPNGVAAITTLSSQLIANLNADLLDGSDWSAPPVIGDVVPNDANFNALSANVLDLAAPDGTQPIITLSKTVVPNLTVTRVQDVEHLGVIKNDTAGFKSKRVSTGSVGIGARASIAVNWTTVFPSANYTVSAEIFDALNPGTAGLVIERIIAQTADHVTLGIINNGAEARTGTIHCLAFRES